MTKLSAKCMALRVKVERDAVVRAHRGHLRELKTEPNTLSSIEEIQL
jgi:hypothetical protein